MRCSLRKFSLRRGMLLLLEYFEPSKVDHVGQTRGNSGGTCHVPTWTIQSLSNINVHHCSIAQGTCDGCVTWVSMVTVTIVPGEWGVPPCLWLELPVTAQPATAGGGYWPGGQWRRKEATVRVRRGKAKVTSPSNSSVSLIPRPHPPFAWTRLL